MHDRLLLHINAPSKELEGVPEMYAQRVDDGGCSEREGQPQDEPCPSTASRRPQTLQLRR